MISEIVQFGLVLSVIYVLFVTINFIIKLYGRFKLQNETRFQMTNWEKGFLLISITYIITYLV